MSNYGSAVGGIIGTTMVVGAVSKLIPKNKKKVKRKKKK